MDFRQLKTLNIPEGVVIKIATPDGLILWEKRGVEPDIPDIPNNEIWYTSTDRKIIEFYDLPSDNTLISNTYENGIGKMVFENDLTELVEEMFSYKRNLETIILPNSITSIGGYAFFNCNSLTAINIPEGVKYIYMYTFDSCYSLTQVKLPKSLIAIDYGAFFQCTSLQNITIPNSVTFINGEVFGNCESLISIKIPDNITTIERELFRGCTKLVSVILSNTITSIGFSSFRGCESLSEITIPNSVTSIDSYAFYNCSLLSNITCKALTAPTLGDSAFNGLPEVGTLYINEGASGYDVWLENLPDGWSIQYIVPELPEPLSNEIYYTTTDGNIIEFYSYYKGEQPKSNTYENGIGKMVFFNKLQEIGSQMFYGQKTLKTIKLPNSVTSLQYYVFSNCTSLEQVNIPINVESIEEQCFFKCEKLKSLIIPPSISHIGTQPFNPNIQITSNSDRFVIENDCLIDKEKNILIQGLVNKSNYTYQTPNNITSIREFAFNDCDNITAVNIAEGVKNIGERAFSYCSNLEVISFPSTIQSIGYMSFYYTTHIKNITCKAMYAPDINGSFYFPTNSSITEKYLYIPDGAKYYDSGDWKTYVLDRGFELQYITE